MIETKVGVDASDITHGSTRVLFVEGAKSSIDAIALRELLDINIKAIGKSSEIRPAAKSFRYVHPDYFFLVDRDYCDASEVERSWKEFETKEGNLIIWRKKEIENYFLEPKFLCQSNYFIQENIRTLENKIISFAKENLYLTVVKLVITSVREEMKYTWIQLPEKAADFPDKNSSLAKLLTMPELKNRTSVVSDMLKKSVLEEKFNSYLKSLTAGKPSLEWGQGEWLSLIPGKSLFHRIIHSASFFSVKNENGKLLQGPDKEKVIIKNLMRKEYLPTDFILLRNMLKQRINR